MRVDIKNYGNADNAVVIGADNAIIDQPEWYANEQGFGQILESTELKQRVSITVINDGKLLMNFLEADRREKGKRFPLWIDYKSIKINGKEILSTPVATWHDKPFRYEIPMKDEQKIT